MTAVWDRAPLCATLDESTPQGRALCRPAAWKARPSAPLPGVQLLASGLASAALERSSSPSVRQRHDVSAADAAVSSATAATGHEITAELRLQLWRAGRIPVARSPTPGLRGGSAPPSRPAQERPMRTGGDSSADAPRPSRHARQRRRALAGSSGRSDGAAASPSRRGVLCSCHARISRRRRRGKQSSCPAVSELALQRQHAPLARRRAGLHSRATT